jgi:hypothetical protein
MSDNELAEGYSLFMTSMRIARIGFKISRPPLQASAETDE